MRIRVFWGGSSLQRGGLWLGTFKPVEGRAFWGREGPTARKGALQSSMKRAGGSKFTSWGWPQLQGICVIYLHL